MHQIAPTRAHRALRGSAAHGQDSTGMPVEAQTRSCTTHDRCRKPARRRLVAAWRVSTRQLGDETIASIPGLVAQNLQPLRTPGASRWPTNSAAATRSSA